MNLTIFVDYCRAHSHTCEGHANVLYVQFCPSKFVSSCSGKACWWRCSEDGLHAAYSSRCGGSVVQHRPWLLQTSSSSLAWICRPSLECSMRQLLSGDATGILGGGRYEALWRLCWSSSNFQVPFASSFSPSFGDWCLEAPSTVWTCITSAVVATRTELIACWIYARHTCEIMACSGATGSFVTLAFALMHHHDFSAWLQHQLVLAAAMA